MKAPDYARLIVLAAIWGASFIFMRIAAPVLGPVATADLRVLIAGLALAVWFRATGFDAEWPRYWKQYAAIGTVNSGLPFLLYSFAALHIPAPLSAVLNSSAPMNRRLTMHSRSAIGLRKKASSRLFNFHALAKRASGADGS